MAAPEPLRMGHVGRVQDALTFATKDLPGSIVHRSWRIQPDSRMTVLRIVVTEELAREGPGVIDVPAE